MPLSYCDLSTLAGMAVRQFGERAYDAISEKIGLFLLLNDFEGAEMWDAVAARIALLNERADGQAFRRRACH